MHHAVVRASTATRGLVLAVLASMVLASTAPVSHASFDDLEPSMLCSTIDELQFNGTDANASIAWQVGLGPAFPVQTPLPNSGPPSPPTLRRWVTK